MAILVDGNSHVMVQGITGTAARGYTKLMLEYGTRVIGGVSPGKGGQTIHGIPVYDTIRQCQEQHPDVNVSVIWVPARHARDAVLEAVEAGIRLIVLTTQGVPVHDILYIRQKAWEKGLTVIGGNTLGLISPGKCLVGMLPKVAFRPGHIGIIARSGILSYHIANTLDLNGMGVSTNVVLGGDAYLGSGYDQFLRRFEEDAETQAIVLGGQPGGAYEENTITSLRNLQKPVVAYIAGVTFPEGQWPDPPIPPVMYPRPTGANKVMALREAGIPVAETLLEIPRLIKKAWRK